jgi:hypothetical protein
VAKSVVKVDYVAESSDGPMLRFVGTAEAVALIRDAFDHLAAGHSGSMDFLDLQVPVVFRTGTRGGVRAKDEAFGFEGDAEQWTSRARLLDPLTESTQGFQYLDCEARDGIGAVVSTYSDGSF